MLTSFTTLNSKRSKTAFKILAVCFLATLSGACATTVDKMDQLNSALKGYEKALRWAKFEAAYSFHKWDTDEQPSIPSHLKDIRLTGYDVGNRSFDEDAMTAKQTVTIRFYDQNDLRERTEEDRQDWKYFPDKKRWYLMSKPPSFQ